MEFKYKGKLYILGEVKEPHSKATYDFIVIFEVVGEKYNFINYFYGADEKEDVLIKIAKEYIDMKKD